MKPASGAITELRLSRAGRPGPKLPPAVSIGLGLGALLWPAVGLGAEVRPEIRYVYYDVPYTRGLPPSEMIQRHTPLVNDNGRRLSGITDYLHRYEMEQDSPVPGVCSVKNPKVFCECEITLPRLVGAEKDQAARNAFEAELADIRRHELTHCDIAVDYADQLLASYRNFKDMLCQNGEEAVRREFERIVDECWNAQIQFDHSEYGYKDHLEVGDFKRAVGSKYRISSQTKDGSKPSLGSAEPDRPPRAAPPRRDPLVAPPIRMENDVIEQPPPQPAPTAPSGLEAPAERGIYKDQDGVWRNY